MKNGNTYHRRKTTLKKISSVLSSTENYRGSEYMLAPTRSVYTYCMISSTIMQDENAKNLLFIKHTSIQRIVSTLGLQSDYSGC